MMLTPGTITPLCVHVCMCVCMYLSVCLCVHMCVSECLSVCIHICVRLHVCVLQPIKVARMLQENSGDAYVDYIFIKLCMIRCKSHRGWYSNARKAFKISYGFLEIEDVLIIPNIPHKSL